MLSASQAFVDAVTASVNTPIAKVVVDFGDGAGPVDITDDVSGVTPDRSLVTNIPGQARLTEGFASAAATITLGYGTAAEPASHAYSPYVKSYTLGGDVTVDVGYDLAGGPEYVRVFTGTLQSVETPSMGRVTLEALDARASMADMYLPTLDNMTASGREDYGLDGHYVMGYLLDTLGYRLVPPPRAGVIARVPLTGSTFPIVGGVLAQNNPEHIAGPFGEAMRPRAALTFREVFTPLSLVHPDAVDLEGWFETGGALDVDLMAVGNPDPATFEEDRIEIEVYTDGRLVGWVKRWDTATAAWAQQGFYLTTTAGVIGAGWHYIAARFIPHSDGTYRWWARVYGPTVDETNFADGDNASEGGDHADTTYFYCGHDPALGSTVTPGMSAFMIHQVSGVPDTEPTWWNHLFQPTPRVDPSVLRLDIGVEAGKLDGWRVCQDLAEAELGIFGFDEKGEPFFRNLHWPHGSTQVIKTIDAADASTITPELNRSNVYGAVSAVAKHFRQEGETDQYFWEAQQKYRLDGDLEINADAGRPIFAVDTSITRLAVNDADAATDGTAYRANTEADGSGTDVAAAFTFDTHATGTIIKSTTNPGGSTGVGYLVGTSGEPALWITGLGVEKSGSTKEVAGSGTPELALATNEWRHDAYNLRPVLLRLLDDLSTPRAVITGLRVWPDPRLQLTDRVNVVDTAGLGLDGEFHVTATTLTFSADGLTQSLELREATPLFHPSDVSGLVAHFDAADPFGDATLPAGGAALDSWTNLVDGTAVTQATAANQPTWHDDRTLTGRPAVRFDAGAVYLSGSFSLPNDKTIIAVGQCLGLGAGGGDYVIGELAGANKWAVNQANTAASAPKVGLWSGVGAYADYLLQGAGFVAVTAYAEGDIGQVRVNGKFGALQSGQNTESSDELFIGPNNTTHWGNMELTSLFIWDRVLTGDELQRVEQWAGHTYGISIGK